VEPSAATLNSLLLFSGSAAIPEAAVAAAAYK